MAKIQKAEKAQINFNETLNLQQNAIMARLNCHNIGRILEFDPTTQLCTVELMQIKQFGDQAYTPAPITQVPLIMLGAGNAHITMPNPVGTTCLLLFLDRNMDNFMETGEQYMPDTARMHDFTDCVALTTFKTLVNPIQNYDEQAISLLNEDIIDEVNHVTSLKIYPDSVEVQTTGKIKLANTAQNLATLMQSFLTACENITVATNTGIITPESKQAFINLKTQFEELLK